MRDPLRPEVVKMNISAGYESLVMSYVFFQRSQCKTLTIKKLGT